MIVRVRRERLGVCRPARGVQHAGALTPYAPGGHAEGGCGARHARTLQHGPEGTLVTLV